MECVLILKGSYWNDNGLSEDDQHIDLFEEGTPIKLSFTNKVIEDAWYSAKVRLHGFDSAIEKVELLINDEQIKCRGLDYTRNEDAVEFSLVLPEDKKQPFLLYYEIVTIKLLIFYNETYLAFCSQEIPCVSKNNYNFRNVGQMIADILDFEDETINEWIYNVNLHTSNMNYGMLQGSYKKDAPKSVFSFVQLLKEIYNCYYRNIYLFKNQIKHIVIDCERMISYDRVKSIGHNEFVWLMHNSDQLNETQDTSTINYAGTNYLPRKVRANETVRYKDVYENRLVYSFLKLIVNKLILIKNSYADGLIQEKEIIAKLHSFEDEGFYSPIVLVKESQLKKGNSLLKELEILSGSFQKVLLWYKRILECQEIKVDRMPRKTKTFQAVKHYNEIYNLIIKWFKYGEFSLRKEELLLKVKKIDKIFEYYSLMKLLKKAKDMGFMLDEQVGGVNFYSYRIKNNRYEDVPDVNNTYCLTDGINKLTIYYQPVLFSSEGNDTNNINLFRTDIDHYWMPDFVFKMYNTEEQNIFYAISDAKYSNRKNIREIYLPQEMVKYVCSVADKTGQTPAVRFMWLLQGREYSGNQMEYFHKSKLSKTVKPIPSYGIYTLNPLNDSVDRLWSEMMRCILSINLK